MALNWNILGLLASGLQMIKMLKFCTGDLMHVGYKENCILEQ